MNSSNNYTLFTDALSEGKTIQYKGIATSYEWVDIGEGTLYSISFDDKVENYRIKPTLSSKEV